MQESRSTSWGNSPSSHPKFDFGAVQPGETTHVVDKRGQDLYFTPTFESVVGDHTVMGVWVQSKDGTPISVEGPASQVVVDRYFVPKHPITVNGEPIGVVEAINHNGAPAKLRS